MFDNSIFETNDDDTDRSQANLRRIFSNLENFDLATAATPQTEKYKRSWEFHLKRFNWTVIPILAHIALVALLACIGLAYDGILPTEPWVYTPLLILAGISILFPLLFTVQRKLECKEWGKPRRPYYFDYNDDRLLAHYQHQTTAGHHPVNNNLPTPLPSPPLDLTNSQQETLLQQSFSDLDAHAPFAKETNVLERIYKHVVFNDPFRVSNAATLDNSHTNPSISFLCLHWWIAFILILTWIYLGAQDSINVRELPLLWFLPTYIILGLAIVFFWVPSTIGIWFALPSLSFTLTSVLIHTQCYNLGHLAIYAIIFPQLLYPGALAIFTIFVSLYTNSLLFGSGMLIVTTIFTSWFALMLGYLHNYLRPEDSLEFLTWPLSVSMVPAYIVLSITFSLIFFKSEQ